MDRLDYGSTFDLLARFAGGLATLLAAYVEPNAAVWLAAGGAAFLSPAIGRDRPAITLVRHIVTAMFVGIWLSQLAAPITHLPAPPWAFILAWLGPDILDGVLVSIRKGELSPRAVLAAVVDHILGRSGSE